MIYLFSSAEALVLRSGVLTHKSMYIDGFFYTSSCLTGLYYFFFLRYLAMQYLASIGFGI